MSDSIEEPFVNSAELAGRPRAIVAIYGGPTWAVLNPYDEVVKLLAEVEGDERIELQAHQDGQLEPARIQVNPHLVATCFEVTEDRYKSDLIERKAKEQMMREAAARGDAVLPPGMG